MNRTILSSLLFTILLISGCHGQSTNEEVKNVPKTEQNTSAKKDVVRVNYSEKINGYEVSVIWKPNELRAGHAIGPAILEFKSDKSNFTITNNFFALTTEQFKFVEKDNVITAIKSNEITLKYQEPSLQNGTFENVDFPFVFVDLNFDENKELLITKWGQGQRWVNSYSAYSFKDGELESDRHQITSKEPYNQIDFKTTFNKNNKELILFLSGGVCASEYKTYGLNNGKYYLVKIVRMDYEDGRCYKSTYSVENGVEKLISKKEVEE